MPLHQGPGWRGTPPMTDDPLLVLEGIRGAVGHVYNLERHTAFQGGAREGTKAKNTEKREILAVPQEGEGQAQHGWAGGGDRKPHQGHTDGSWQPVRTDEYVH